MWKIAILTACKPCLLGKQLQCFFLLFWGGSEGGCDLVDRNKMQDMSTYLHLEAEQDLSVTQPKQRVLGKRSVLPGSEQELEPDFTISQGSALIRRLLNNIYPHNHTEPWCRL